MPLAVELSGYFEVDALDTMLEEARSHLRKRTHDALNHPHRIRRGLVEKLERVANQASPRTLASGWNLASRYAEVESARSVALAGRSSNYDEEEFLLERGFDAMDLSVMHAHHRLRIEERSNEDPLARYWSATANLDRAEADVKRTLLRESTPDELYSMISTKNPSYLRLLGSWSHSEGTVQPIDPRTEPDMAEAQRYLTIARAYVPTFQDVLERSRSDHVQDRIAQLDHVISSFAIEV